MKIFGVLIPFILLIIMNSSDSLVKFAWLTFSLNCLLVFAGGYLRIEQSPGAKEILTAGILLLPVLWFLLVWDILKNPVHNKQFWLIAIFVFGNIGPLLYLIRRDSLMAKNER